MSRRPSSIKIPAKFAAGSLETAFRQWAADQLGSEDLGGIDPAEAPFGELRDAVEGYQKTNVHEPTWYEGLIHFAIERANEGSNSIWWINLILTLTDPQTGRTISGSPVIKFRNEMVRGIVTPKTDEGVAQLAAKFPNWDGIATQKPRDSTNYGPTVCFDRWERTEKDDDGQVTGHTGESILMRYIELIDLAFLHFYEYSMETGLIAGSSERNPIANPHQIKVQNTMLRPRVSREFKEGPQKGKIRANPRTRITIPFDKKTGMPNKLAFLDGDKMVEDSNGKPRPDYLMVEGELVNSENVHMALLPGSLVDGVLKMDAVCCSSTGISVPCKFDSVLVVRAPQYGSGETTFDELYDDADLFASSSTPIPGPSDATPDATPDAAPDATPDAAPDAAPDATPDATPDAAPLADGTVSDAQAAALLSALTGSD